MKFSFIIIVPNIAGDWARGGHHTPGREKNRLGKGLSLSPRKRGLGQLGGNLALWGPELFFSVVPIRKSAYKLWDDNKILVTSQSLGENVSPERAFTAL